IVGRLNLFRVILNALIVSALKANIVKKFEASNKDDQHTDKAEALCLNKSIKGHFTVLFLWF
ncbi:hypothetical protein, partial [Mailhella sp.]|uniref:hypothetical protein n=1 Tax=Mailhella sp. TaxID=1981029 RepID=UPI0040640778